MQRPLSSIPTVPREPRSSKVFGNDTAPLDLNSCSVGSCTTQPQMQANDTNQHQDSWVDQPLTRLGRARMRVFIACLPCRKNKRRCDGLRPICTICERKGFVVPPSYVDSSAPEAHKGYCIYDVTPKRRGPDRTPRSRLKRNKQIDDDERPTKRRHTTRGDIPKQEPQPFGRVSPPPSPNEMAQPILLRTQDDRLSISLAVATPGSIWKRKDTDNATPSTTGYDHIEVPSTSVLFPGGTTSSSPSSSASRHFIRSSLLATKDPLPSVVVPRLDYEPPPRSVSSSQSYAPVSSPVAPDPLGQPSISPNPLPVLDPDSHYADYALPVSGVTTVSYPTPYSTHSLLQSEYDFWRPVSLIRQEECEDSICKSCSSVFNPSQWDTATPLPLSPSADYIQKTWYESLLAFYASFDFPDQQFPGAPSHAVTIERRLRAQSMVTVDLRRVFAVSTWWTSFINVPYLFSIFHNPDRRSSSAMQPALVLAALALSVFFTGSEAEGGQANRDKAGMLRDLAQAAIESSLAVGWIDCNLAKAAWLLALYEAQPHPSHSLLPCRSSIRLLDSIVRALGLTMLDAGNPNANTFDVDAMPHQRVPQRRYRQNLPTSYTQTPYPPQIATISSPAIHRSSPTTIVDIAADCQVPIAVSRRAQEKGGCNCSSLLLSQNSPKSQLITPFWGFTPDWAPEWSEADIEKEEARRLVWASLMLAAGHTSHAASHGIHRREALDFWLTRAENYALLYPGEALLSSADPRYDRSRPYCDTIWALYARAQLLWHSCLRMRQAEAIGHEANNELEYYRDGGAHEGLTGDLGRPGGTESGSAGVMAQFAVRVWLETVDIEKKLNSHTCATEKAFLFHGREYLFNVRMCITYEFSRYVPSPDTGTDRLFNRHKAAEWLSWQARISQGVMQGLGTMTGLKFNVLAKRPFFVWWFMSHLGRCLFLWECDHSMTHALELCRAFLPPCEYLTCLWPCQNQRTKYLALRQRYDNACLRAGVALSPPPNLNRSFNGAIESLV